VRAPDQDFVAYSVAQWAEIKTSLATLGIDADTVIVGERALHEELVEIARIFSTPFKRSTPKQKAKRQRETLVTIEALLGKFNYASMGMASIHSVTAREELEALAVKLRIQIEKLDAEGSSSRGNALMDERNEYLIELMHVWDTAIVPAAARRRRRKDQIRFLLACASPLFPKTTESAIKNYLDRRPQTRA
jgi:hypothetical protein